MVAELSIQFGTYVLPCTSFLTSYDGHDTHSNNDREEPRDYPIDEFIELVIRRGGTVDCVESAVDVQGKQVVVSCKEVSIDSGNAHGVLGDLRHNEVE
jgi:hypothetical protein